MFSYDKTPRYHPQRLSSYQLEQGSTRWYVIAHDEEQALKMVNLLGHEVSVTTLTQGTAPALYRKPTIVLVQHKPYKAQGTSK